MRDFVIRTTNCCVPHITGLRGSYIGGSTVTALLDIRQGSRAWGCLRKQKGVWSDITRSVSRAYTFDEFAWQSRINDIVEINHSSPQRQGRTMSASYQRTAEDFGHQDDTATITEPTCSQHWRKTVGVFDRWDTLVAYISLIRSDNIALYGMILGHADHLSSGVMHRMHSECLILLQGCGVEAIMYAGWKDGGPGLQSWKRRLGFEPVRLVEA